MSRNGEIFLVLEVVAAASAITLLGYTYAAAAIMEVCAKKRPKLTHTWKANEAEMLSNIHEHS